MSAARESANTPKTGTGTPFHCVPQQRSLTLT